MRSCSTRLRTRGWSIEVLLRRISSSTNRNVVPAAAYTGCTTHADVDSVYARQAGHKSVRVFSSSSHVLLTGSGHREDMRGKEIPFLVVFLLMGAVAGFFVVRGASGVDRTPVPEIPLASVTPPAATGPAPSPSPARPTEQESDTPVVGGGGVPVDRDEDRAQVDRPSQDRQASGDDDHAGGDDDADDGGDQGDAGGDGGNADEDDDDGDGDDDSGDDDDEGDDD